MISIHKNHPGLQMNESIPAVACTFTGSAISIIDAIKKIEANFVNPVDLWMLPCSESLKSWLEQQSTIRRVFFSPVRDTALYHPNANVHALPVYGKYDVVLHLEE